MSKSNPEDESLRRRVLASLEEDSNLSEKLINGKAESKTRISKEEFLMFLLQEKYDLSVKGNKHNLNVAQINTLTAHATRLNEISGLKVYYYFDSETNSLSIEAESNYLGMLPEETIIKGVNLELEEEVPISLKQDTDSNKDVDEDNYQEVDKTDFFLIASQIINYLNRITEEINHSLVSIDAILVEVEEFEEQSGVQLEFYWDNVNEQPVYVVGKKRPMGFSIPSSKKEPDIKEIE